MEVNHYLTHFLAIREAEKGTHGEVFTPIDIIDTMLSMLPSAVWSNPAFRWLDPACGIGNFPLKVVYGGAEYPGLFQGLARQIPDPKARLRHIWGTMLVCTDINASNIRRFRAFVGKVAPGIPTQIHTADFLEAVFEDGFDIVLGNPPYNAGGTKRVGEKRLHVRFTERALELLRPKGHLLFVCPPNYREAGSVMNRLFATTRGHFVRIVILGPNETHRLFRVQARVDMFLWQSDTAGATAILDELGDSYTVRLNLDRHVPNFGFSIFAKLRASPAADLRPFRNTEATTITCEKSGFTARGRFPILHLIVGEGRKILRRRKAHSLQNEPKILLNGLGVPYVYYDREGVYGVSQIPVILLNPTEELYRFMKSPIFQVIVWGLRITGNNNLPYLFQDVPSGFGKGIEWTVKERAVLERFRVPEFEDRDIMGTCS
jgi:hypothetical protein